MTNKELIQRILSLYSKGVHTSDIRLSKRHVYHKLLTVRNLLIVQQSNKKQRIGLEAYQSLKCIRMIKADLSECSCVPKFLREKYKIYKSDKQIPNILKSINGLLISDITTITGEDRLDITNYASLKYYTGRKYGLNKPFVFLYDNYLYMINATYEILHLTAIFSEPLKVLEFEDCDCNNTTICNNYLDEIFPIPNAMEESLLAIARDELLILFQHGKIDKSNNSQDNSNQQQIQE